MDAMNLTTNNEDWLTVENSTMLNVTTTPSMTIWPTLTTREVFKKELKWLFFIHIYGFACLFFILAFFAFFSILNLRSLMLTRPYMATINIFICLLGTVRACCLFIDPYNFLEYMPKVMASILWDAGLPAVIAAFCLIQLAFLQLTQLKVGPERMRKKSCLSFIITAHFCCIIGSDIIVTFQDQLTILQYIFQTVFLCWGIFLCSTFLHAGYKMMLLLKLMPPEMLMRQLPDNNKGIMQLAMLAPYNNLASCLTAALMPTLLAPKIRITDENDSTFSVGSDTPTAVPNVKLKPDSLDLPLRRVSPVIRRKSSTKDMPSVIVRPPTPVAAMPSMNIIPLSRRESLPCAASAARNCEQSANNRRGSNVSIKSIKKEQKASIVSVRSQDERTATGDDESSYDEGVMLQKQHPNLYTTQVTVYSRKCSNGSQSSARLDNIDDTTSKTTHKEDFNLDLIENDESVLQDDDDQDESKNGKVSKNDCETEDRNDHVDDGKGKTVADCASGKKKGRNDSNSDEKLLTELLPQRQTNTDVTLDSILNHIAYVNRTSTHAQLGVDTCDRKGQVRRVLHVTYATAILGLILCLTDIIRLYGPYMLTAINQKTDGPDEEVTAAKGQALGAWTWFCHQTLCRAIEFAMGCAMANMTKQPANTRQPHLFNHPMGLTHREPLYI